MPSLPYRFHNEGRPSGVPRTIALMVVVLVAVAVAAVLPRLSNAAGPGPESRLRIPRTGALGWGVYQILWSQKRYPHELDREVSVVGGSPDFVMFFRDLERPYPHAVCEAIGARGAIPVISIEVEHWGGAREGRLAAIVRGEYDAFFTAYARQARASGHLALFRFGFEMNGDWFPWGGQPELFKTAWRRLHGIFRREGASNLLWVWSPNAVSGPDTPANGLEKYWPGGDVVDIIGLDGYNFGDHYSRWHRWESFPEIFDPALTKIRESGVPHPVLIAEFGCTHDADPVTRARWIREAHAYLSARPEVVGAIWFNFDKRREGEKNWRIDADPLSLEAWRETFLSPIEIPETAGETMAPGSATGGTSPDTEPITEPAG